MGFEYIEPDDHFPKEIRKKYKLGEYAPIYRANKNGYFVFKGSIYYIELDDEGELKALRGWPNDAEVSETKKGLAKKAVVDFDDSPKEMIYMIGHSKNEVSFIAVCDGGVHLLENELVEKQMILFPEEADCYTKMYQDEISKFLPDWQQEAPLSFWEKMATTFPGITPDDAVEYIKDHVDEFKVEGKFY